MLLKLRLYLSLVAILIATNLFAAPQKNGYVQDSAALREMQATIGSFRHEMQNHESEIRTFEEKLANQEIVIESLREESSTALKKSQEAEKSTIANLEMKLNSFDTALKGLISDFKELKTHANQTQQKIVETEKVLKAQGENLALFQSALKSIMTILEVNQDLKVADEGKVKTYKVQSGDNLEKIAKLHKTTIKAIKAMNQDLSSDRIVIGQIIKIP